MGTTCYTPAIDSDPNYSDCRWKTQNVSVTGNVFDFDPSAISGCTTATQSCGMQGLFSEYGSDPSWSPYQGWVVADAITSSQNDQFSDNTYTGPWQFMVHDQSTIVDSATWQSTWGQDPGSTFNGATSNLTATSLSATLSGGGQTGGTITVPSGTPVTDIATLIGANASEATGTITYSVYSDSACTDAVSTGTAQTIIIPGTVPPSSPVTLDAPGTYYWQASYSGDAANIASSSPCTSTIETIGVATSPNASTLTVQNATGATGQPTTVSAVLSDGTTSDPISGESVTLTLNGTETCSATTDDTGTARCAITPGEPAGSYSLEAAFAGDADEAPSTGVATFRVTVDPTSLSYTGPTTAVNGDALVMFATLTSGTSAVSDAAVTFTLGSGISTQTCSATTDDSGVAICMIGAVIQPVGTAPVTAAFAGNDLLGASIASDSVTIHRPDHHHDEED